jgi:hypothetical protein
MRGARLAAESAALCLGSQLVARRAEMRNVDALVDCMRLAIGAGPPGDAQGGAP